jgi:hypothetical protein
VAEKRTIDDDAYLQRKSESLRALVEDRYGRANGASAIVYRKTRAPMLGDPQRPPDQMDNFPAGETDRVVAGLARQPKSTARRPGLSNVKTPWGW